MKSMKCLFIIGLILMVFSVFGQFGSDFGMSWTKLADAAGTEGWAGAQANELFTAVDNNYVYFRATNAAIPDWGNPGMTWVFIVNTNDTTGSSVGTKDVWSREVYYQHSPGVNWVAVGQFGGGWAEIYEWSGSGFTRVYYGESGAPGGEWANANMDNYRYVAGNRLEVQARFPKADIGYPATVDVQYYITGNNDEHGCFDSIPADNRTTDWNAPASATNISNYEPGVSNVLDWMLY